MPPSQTPQASTLVGIALMLGAMIVLPFLDVVAKFLGQQNVPIIEIVWARLFFGMVMTAPLVWRYHRADAERKRDAVGLELVVVEAVLLVPQAACRRACSSRR